MAAAALLCGCATPREYPFCNVKCPAGTVVTGVRCKADARDLDGAGRLVERHSGYSGTEVIRVSAGLAVVSSTSAGHELLEKHWTAFSCAAADPPMQPIQGLAYSQCAGNALEWLALLRAGPASNLMSQAKYRTICLGYQ